MTPATTVPTTPPSQSYIQGMFDRLARRYDTFNRLTSLGLHNVWRQKAVSFVRPGMRILDLGCGTGDLSLAAAKRLAGNGEVVGLDFSEKMLEIAEKRAQSAGLTGVRWERRGAEEIPFETEPYDAVVSGFVLRNIYENIDAILRGVYRSLKHGGRVSFLDFTEPQDPVRKTLFNFYMDRVAGFYGALLFGKDYPVPYLTESAKRFAKVPEFTAKLERTGFRQITAKKTMLGIIVLYQAVK